jgi:hypothetical protein
MCEGLKGTTSTRCGERWYMNYENLPRFVKAQGSEVWLKGWQCMDCRVALTLGFDQNRTKYDNLNRGRCEVRSLTASLKALLHFSLVSVYAEL